MTVSTCSSFPVALRIISHSTSCVSLLINPLPTALKIPLSMTWRKSEFLEKIIPTLYVAKHSELMCNKDLLLLKRVFLYFFFVEEVGCNNLRSGEICADNVV